MKKSDLNNIDFLKHILDAIQNIRKHRAYDNETGQKAIQLEITIIGEAINNLTDELRASNPHIEWGAIVGTRNRIIHGYFGINEEIIEGIVEEEINELEVQISAILEKEQGGQ